MSTEPGEPPAPPPEPRLRRRWMPVAAIVVLLVATAYVAYHWGADNQPPVAAPTGSTSASPTPPTTAEIYQAVAPSVVSVVADIPGGTSNGTGVIVNADAQILTALHVVDGSTAVHVVFADGSQSAATVAAADPTIDVALLIPGSLPSVVVPAVLGGQHLAVGDSVIAIGDQLGLTRTTTQGVVSGLDRSAPGPDGVTLNGLIQFDAAVNHGSSGGPLVDAAGELVGIVISLVNPTTDGTFIGIGFAVPIGMAVTADGGQPIPR